MLEHMLALELLAAPYAVLTVVGPSDDPRTRARSWWPVRVASARSTDFDPDVPLQGHV
jgi:hypothetical protein